MASQTLSIATWNINSVRLRIDQVVRMLAEQAPDVLCLQEIKCQEHQFPAETLAQLGYVHQAVHGQKGYHGVARSEEHTSELQSLMRISYAVFCLKKIKRISLPLVTLLRYN